MNETIKQWWPIVAALFLGAGGASSLFVSREQATAEAKLAAAEAKLAAADKCWAALEAVERGSK